MSAIADSALLAKYPSSTYTRADTRAVLNRVDHDILSFIHACWLITIYSDMILMKVLGNYPFVHDSGCEVLCFDGKSHESAETFDPHHPAAWNSIVETLPAGWEPDVVIVKTPQYFPLPRGIERCPWPTVVLLDDWFGSVDYLPDNLRRFDYIFTDRASMGLLQTMGFANVAYWPCFGHDPRRFRLMPEVKRDIDVSFAGNFNSNIQTERLPWIRRVCELSPEFHIEAHCGLWGDDYVRLLNRSRIVFNRSIKGEMNMRAFEAPACGALLFLEEENLEVRDFLEPGAECVLYNDGNLESLIDYYLRHEDDRGEIASAGARRIQQYSYPRLFSALLEKVADMGIKPGRNRTNPRSYFAGVEHRDLVQQCLSSAGRPPDALQRITTVIHAHPGAPLPLNDCAVVLLTVIEDRRMKLSAGEMGALQTMAIQLLDAALAIDPRYLTARFNRGQALFLFGRPENARQEYETLLTAPPENEYVRYQGQVYPVHYQFPLRYLWSAVLRDALPDREAAAKARHRAISYFSLLRLAALAAADKNQPEAIQLCERADRIITGHPFAAFTRATAMEQLPLHERRLEAYRAAIERNPFKPDLWYMYARNLIQNGNRAQAKRFIETASLLSRRVCSIGERVATELAGMINA